MSWRDAGGLDVVAQEVHLGDTEKAFFGIGRKSGLPESVEGLLQVLPVLLFCFAVEENGIQVGKGAVMACQDMVHEPLEGVAGVEHADCHACELKKFWDVLQVQGYLVGTLSSDIFLRRFGIWPPWQ